MSDKEKENQMTIIFHLTYEIFIPEGDGCQDSGIFALDTCTQGK